MKKLNSDLRVITAMITPFNQDESLNLNSTQLLAQHLEKTGSDAIVIAGTTGESPTLTTKETKEVFLTVKDAVSCPVIYGAGSSSTDSMLLNMSLAEKCQADGLLIVSPYYNRPPQSAIKKYFETANKNTDLPIIVYDIPTRTGRGIEFDTMTEILSLDNVVGLKDAAGSPKRASKLKATLDTRIWSGDDDINIDFIRKGAEGAISVASHWHGELMQKAFSFLFEGKDKLAEDLLQPFNSILSLSNNDRPNPISTKMILNHLGHNVGPCRAPLDVSEPFTIKELEILNNFF